MIEKIHSILKNTFGYHQFRPLQQKIIENVLQKRDTLVIMPTGGGKSICYQIPALIFDGMTVVVSPLISLMKDQVEQLQDLGAPALFLNSSLPPEEYQKNFDLVRTQKIKLLYIAPESLLTSRILNLLETIPVECLTIDEAHCISEWGHDFRPEYRQLVRVRQKFKSAVCIALTATATPRVQKDIKDNLGFLESNEFIASFNRPNLFLQIIPKTDPYQQTLQFLDSYKNQSGIIYCFSRRQVDELAAILESQGYSVKPYHAGMEDKERARNQELFIKDDVQIMVATIAFGMGIDKPNIRFVVHYDLPKNIESYYQQIGRAGRDGLRSHCLLLFGYADLSKIRYFLDQKPDPERRIAYQHLDALVAFAESQQCRRLPLLQYFGEEYHEPNCSMCDNCLAGEKKLDDLTIPAQKFLSCVIRTGKIFGANHIIDVLRGSEAEKVLDFGHHQLSTYGIGKEYSKKQWLHLARQFIQQKLLIKDDRYGSLLPTEKALEILRGDQKFYGLIQEEKADFEKRKDFDMAYDRELFEKLRAKRKEIADRANVPPYIVFSDKSLIEMAGFYPRSRSEFLEIHGVGQVKWDKYGPAFMNLIISHCKMNGIEAAPAKRQTVMNLPFVTSEKRRFEQVGELYNNGSSIEQICKVFAVKPATVLRHLFTYFREGNDIRREGLLTHSKLSPEERAAVLETFKEVGSEYLRPAFEALGGQINFRELEILRLYYLADKK
ncbi:ATP-dependent DNA helicase RecQ [candidate division KSB1 bacterium RBG_16_48_16]|nr:MAG: ATP-dependent DNA helicase RecQ [candidate division KSB1 bacterium RBG_16_48_16]